MTSEQKIWEVVSFMVSKYSSLKPEPSEIHPNDLIKKYFPINNARNINEPQALLFSNVLIESIDFINHFLSLDVSYDFHTREEWELFDTLGDYFIYLVYLTRGVK